MHPQIFVSVAAYADPHLEYTLQSALRQATHPEALVFGILNQTTTPLADKTMLQRFPVRLMQITPQESFGVAWARSVIQSLYDCYVFRYLSRRTAFYPTVIRRDLENVFL